MRPWVEKLVATWGVAWVSLLLGRAVWRLAPLALEPWTQDLMTRAIYLGQNPRPLWVILALPFCMSLFHSTRRQMTVSWVFVVAIVLLIWWVRSLPQPWRGIVDGGVVLGLMWGLGVIWWLFLRYLLGAKMPPPGDIPLEKALQEQPALG
jgi:hypothetical protein